ncbi:hypothetical protein GCM10023096_24600 [Nonomuraea ferruginea]
MRMPKAPVSAARAALRDAFLDISGIGVVTTHNPFAVNDRIPAGPDEPVRIEPGLRLRGRGHGKGCGRGGRRLLNTRTPACKPPWMGWPLGPKFWQSYFKVTSIAHG